MKRAHVENFKRSTQNRFSKLEIFPRLALELPQVEHATSDDLLAPDL